MLKKQVRGRMACLLAIPALCSPLGSSYPSPALLPWSLLFPKNSFPGTDFKKTTKQQQIYFVIYKGNAHCQKDGLTDTRLQVPGRVQNRGCSWAPSKHRPDIVRTNAIEEKVEEARRETVAPTARPVLFATGLSVHSSNRHLNPGIGVYLLRYL